MTWADMDASGDGKEKVAILPSCVRGWLVQGVFIWFHLYFGSLMANA